MKTYYKVAVTLAILVGVVFVAVISLLPTRREITEEEAREIADGIISEEYPDMVGSDVVVKSYSLEGRNICSVMYRRMVTVQTPEDESVQLPRIVIVEIDRSTGEHLVSVSG